MQQRTTSELDKHQIHSLFIICNHIVLRTVQHIEQRTTPKRMIKITVVQDILELHHIVSVSEFDTEHIP